MWLRFGSAILFLSVCAEQATTSPPASLLKVAADVQYCTGGGRPLLMDVFIPRNRRSTPTPAMFWIHGGGWEIGDKGRNSGAKLLASAGFVTASLSYRLSGEAPFPAAIEDWKCAIRFLRANASKYGIDSGRVGVAGSSAGGHLAELVATADASAGLEGDGGWANVPSRVQAAVSYFGVSDLAAPVPPETQRVIVKFIGGTERHAPELYRRASPIEYVSKDDPPLMFVHGTQDHDVPIDQSVRMADRYRRLDLPVEFIAMENAGHDFSRIGGGPIAPSVEAIHRMTVQFFSRHLSDLRVSSRPVHQSVPAAIYTDPSPDPKQPARRTALRIPSHGVSINGLVYEPPGTGPHPTLVICHGLPGNERFLDLAQAVRRAGWNAVTFNYRGSWGSPGAFKFAQNIEDANAVVAYLRDPVNAQPLGVDVDRIVLAGHSMGGWVTVHTAARDPHLIGAIVISAADLGRQGEWPRERLLDLMGGSVVPLAGVTPEGMVEEVRAMGRDFRFESAAAGLTRMPLLALTANDGLAPDTDTLLAAIKANGGHVVTAFHLATDHSWSDHRIALETLIINWLAGLVGQPTPTRSGDQK
jgi:uncharacterized protein